LAIPKITLGGCLRDKRDPLKRLSHFRVTLTLFTAVVVVKLPAFFLASPQWSVTLVGVILFAIPIRDLFQAVPSAELLRALGNLWSPSDRLDGYYGNTFGAGYRDPPGGFGGAP